MATSKKKSTPENEVTAEVKISELENELAATVEVNKQLAELIEKQPEPQAAPEKATKSANTFKVDGAEYGFAMPGVNLNGEVITAVEVLADKALQEKLVAMQSGFIYKIK